MPASNPTYTLWVSNYGNVYMAELAQLLANVLTDLQRDVSVRTAGLPKAVPNNVNLVIAPHEYFVLLRESHSAEQMLDAAAASVCLTTEQMGTHWFELGLQSCQSSPLILDINRSAADELRRRELPAVHLPLGYHSSLDRWHGDKNSIRGCDITVLAAITERREHFLAHACELWWDQRCELRLFSTYRPVTGPQPGFLVGQDKLNHLADSRILVNVHRSSLRYFEWLRMVEAISNGCLVASEESDGYEPLVPFEHFVEAPLDTLAEYALAISLDESWRANLASEAYDHLRSELDMTKAMARLLPAIEEAASSTAIHKRKNPLPNRRSDSPTGHLPSPTTNQSDLCDALDLHEQRTLASAKRLLSAERTTLRTLETIQSAIRYGQDVHIEVERTPAVKTVSPDISVVITLYNYGHQINEAIDSIAGSISVTPEVLVIDDHSTDNSVEIVRRMMAERPWLPITLIRKHANQGLSAARNTGFEMARCEYVFVLDADNYLYPNGLHTLREALDSSSAAFCYGIIDRFHNSAGRASTSLVSHLPWDPRFLTKGNYIDAMALIRRSAWDSVGGYDKVMDETFGGWEDFDLWLRFAAAGYEGLLVPTPVARYRIQEQSMLATFNLELESSMHHLRDKYPTLSWLGE